MKTTAKNHHRPAEHTHKHIFHRNRDTCGRKAQHRDEIGYVFYISKKQNHDDERDVYEIYKFIRRIEALVVRDCLFDDKFEQKRKPDHDDDKYTDIKRLFHLRFDILAGAVYRLVYALFIHAVGGLCDVGGGVKFR